MQIQAKLSYLRIAPRKVRLVSNLLRGMEYEEAREHLMHLPKRSSHPILKLIDSVAANAQNNKGLVKSNLYIKEIRVDEGPILKRYKAKGFGSTMPIAKRTSHVLVILEERVAGLKAESGKKRKEEVKEVEKEVEKKEEVIASKEKHEVKKEIGKKGSGFSNLKRLFRRKSI
ncbi:MAG: 50S ribosomal protein L22 [Parcubacteria group bacterium]